MKNWFKNLFHTSPKQTTETSEPSQGEAGSLKGGGRGKSNKNQEEVATPEQQAVRNAFSRKSQQKEVEPFMDENSDEPSISDTSLVPPPAPPIKEIGEIPQSDNASDTPPETFGPVLQKMPTDSDLKVSSVTEEDGKQTTAEGDGGKDVGTWKSSRFGKRFPKKKPTPPTAKETPKEDASLLSEESADKVAASFKKLEEKTRESEKSTVPEKMSSFLKKRKEEVDAFAKDVTSKENLERIDALANNIGKSFAVAGEDFAETIEKIKKNPRAALTSAVFMIGAAAALSAAGVPAILVSGALTIIPVVATWERIKKTKSVPEVAGHILYGLTTMFIFRLTFTELGLHLTDYLESDIMPPPPQDNPIFDSANNAESTAEEIAAQIGAGANEDATPPPEGTSTNNEPLSENAPLNQVEASTPAIEIPVDISVTARPGDGAITMLMHWAEAAQAQGGNFPEGSVMAQLVQAQNEGGLYEVAQRIAVEQGLYQPDAVNESFNVWEDATLTTVQNPDGSFAFTLANPGGESFSLWSSVGETSAYTGSNMIDTTSGGGVSPTPDTSVAESRILSQGEIQEYRDRGAWQSTNVVEAPSVEGGANSLDEKVAEIPKEQAPADPLTDSASVEQTSAETTTLANAAAERTLALQGEVANLTETSWQTLASQPLPEIFLDQSATAAERAQALMELAGENSIALDEAGAGQLENLLAMMQSTEMSRTYGEVAVTENGEMRTLYDVLIEGFRNKELSS